MNPKTKLLFIASFLATVLIAALVLFFFYAEALRIHVLKPIIEAYYIGRYYLEFVPQLYLWLIPPLIITLIMARRFVRWAKADRSPIVQKRQSITPGEGELARWAQQVHRAHHSRFARVRLSRALVEIGTRLIAGREGSALWRARQQLTEGYWRNHPSISQFLTPRRHYTTRQSGAEFEHSLREAIEHLEDFRDYV